MMGSYHMKHAKKMEVPSKPAKIIVSRDGQVCIFMSTSKIQGCLAFNNYEDLPVCPHYDIAQAC